jgi:iron complex transport system substrate-binding protein
MDGETGLSLSASAASGVPQLGLETQPALEKIVLLKPDIIFASRFRHQDIAPLMRKIAPVALLDDVFEFRKTLTVVAKIWQ